MDQLGEGLKNVALLRSFIEDLQIEQRELICLRDRIIRVVYQAEHVINSFFVRGDPVSKYLLHHILEKIKLVTDDVNKCPDRRSEVTTKSRNIRTSSDYWIRIPFVVGFENEVSVIMNSLIHGPRKLHMVSIVGLPGVGKTTLAIEIYNHPIVRRHFNVLAWCSAETDLMRDILVGILVDIGEPPHELHRMSEEDLSLMLYQRLKRMRYLIVFDDMWDIGLWQVIRDSLPNDRNGSRILCTSRYHSLALQADPYSYVHHLRLLSDDESWDLLQKKLFHEKCCPPELLDIGRQIATGCKGLPLAAVFIAEHLANVDQTPDKWKEVAKNIMSYLSGDPSRPMDIIEESYRQLPDYVRPCFLYLGAFMPEKNVLVSKLIRLWIAEGFIEKSTAKSLEDEAEGYLMELIDRGLVISTKSRTRDGVKTCHVPEWYRDLCVAKVREEKIGLLIHGNDEHNASPTTPYDDRRLCIYSKREQFLQRMPSGPNLQSLLFFSTEDHGLPTRPCDVSFVYNRFKQLRVLDLWCINLGNSFPIGILSLVELRYLAICGQINSIPPTIANLLNLETFLVKGLRGEIKLPDTIWDMVKLRHLHISSFVAFSLLSDYNPNDASQLIDLVTFSTPCLSHGSYVEKIIKRLANIRKLRCAVLESWDFSKKCNRFPRLDFFSQLESLKVFSFGKLRYPCELHFPLNLEKLTMSKFKLPWSEISTIGRLPKLKVLKLMVGSFEGERWDVGYNEFLELRYLKLESLNI